ncbi:MAG TPA: substrate-binding domain-containing protein, partial [Streptosporangiaceae bacterium]|nr:substrate-binding domain-containing protein [Streptosporangiaceae bacterium]
MNGRQGNEYPPAEPGGFSSDPAAPGYRAAGQAGGADWFGPRNEAGASAGSQDGEMPEWFSPRQPVTPPSPYGSGGFTGASDPGGRFTPPASGGRQDDAESYSPYSSRESGPYQQGSGSYETYEGNGGDRGGDGGGGGGWDGGSGDDHRRRKGALIGPLAGAVGLALLAGVAVYAFTSQSTSGCGGSGGVTLNVAASQDIADAVSTIAASFNSSGAKVDGKCVTATVKNADPSAMTTLLSGQGVSQGETQRPDVWIPDSSLWVSMVQASSQGKTAVRPTGTQVAETPLVVAMATPLATQLKGVLAAPSWNSLLSAAGGVPGGAVTKNPLIPAGLIKLSVPDPTRNASGMAALMLTHALLASDPKQRTIFTGIVRTVQHSTTPTVADQFTSLGKDDRGQYPVLLTPEQAVWKYNQKHPAIPATAVYPIEGTANLDYPYTVTTADDVKSRAAALFENAFKTTNAQNAVRSLGFRTADGVGPSTFSDATGVSPRKPRPLPNPSADEVAQVMQAWSKLSLSIRMLTIIDVSGSMTQQVAPGVTREQATIQVAQGGLGLMSDDTEIGTWLFSTDMVGTQPWKEIVPLAPLGKRIGSSTQRQLMLSGLAKIVPKPNGNTALYRTIVAGYKYMKQTYKPDMMNSILLLT